MDHFEITVQSGVFTEETLRRVLLDELDEQALRGVRVDVTLVKQPDDDE